MTACANNICERVEHHWDETGEVLFEVTRMTANEVREIIDGINSSKTDLLSVLETWATE